MLELTFFLFLLLSASASKTEITCSVFLYGRYDWGTEVCSTAIADVPAFCGGSRIHFVITHHWYRLSELKDVDGYCTYHKPHGPCVPFNKRVVQSFQSAMTHCFNEASKLGFSEIEVTPHIDDSSGKKWRNTLAFSPVEKGYEGLSYYDIMIHPLMGALENTKFKQQKVCLSLQGEMSKSILTSPQHWLHIIDIIQKKTKFNVGVGFNFNHLCGSTRCTKENSKKYNRQSIQKLLRKADYIGISNYAPLTHAVHTYEFQNGILIFNKELQALGISVNDLYNTRSRFSIHYAEIGIGGGTQDNVPARNTTEAAASPYAGILGPYDLRTDPWKSNAMTMFKRLYYKQLIKWCSQNTGPDFHVSHVNLWNVASWDHLGIYHESSTDTGSYRDMVVSKMLKDWNDHSKVP